MRNWFKRHKAHEAAGINITTGDKGPTLFAASASLASRSTRAFRTLSKNQGWQDAMWGYYDTVTEVHTGSNWLASACSRALLQVATSDDNGEGEPEPTDNDKVQEVLHRFFNGPSGQAEAIRRIVLHLTLPGESWVCGWNPDNVTTEWRALTSSEFTTKGQSLEIVPNLGEPPVTLTEGNSQIFRIWRPHARYQLMADSSLRSLEPVMKELRGYDAHVNATTESRLAGAGILIIPSSATSTSPGAGEGVDQTGDPFVDELIESGITALQDPTSVGRIMPSVVRVPDGSVENIRHLSLSTPFDERIPTMREAAQKRLAVGMDMPLEILLGLGDTNHWNAWQIDESAVKLYIEPMLTIICAAITEQYLRPILEAENIVPNPQDFMVWFDTAALVQRPNKGPEARELYNMRLLSAEATRRESGFNDEDAPSDEEMLRHLLVDLLVANPSLAPQILPQLGLRSVSDADFVQVEGPAAEPAQIEEAGRNEPPARSDPEPETADTVVASRVDSVREDKQSEVVQWQINVAELAALRALERAGRWILSHSGRKYYNRLRHIPAVEMHAIIATESPQYDDMLKDAYTLLESTLPEHPCIKKTVDTYVRGLMRTQTKHDRERLTEVLAAAGCIGGMS